MAQPSVSLVGQAPDNGQLAWLGLPGNGACFECGRGLEPMGSWADVTCAVSLCTECAGVHRGMGTHRAKVKSLSLDFWAGAEVERLRRGGNQRCLEALGWQAPGAAAPTPAQLLERCCKEELQTYCQQLAAGLESAGPCVGAAASSSSSHAEALADRPGYFRTATGFGCDGGRGQAAAGAPRALGGLLFRRCLAGPAAEAEEAESPPPQRCGAVRDIFHCAEQGDAAGVERCILYGGASPEDVDAVGWTPLHYAARNRKPAVCRLLLRLAKSSRSLADTPERGGLGWTPLQWAAQTGSVECVELLLQAGASASGLRPGSGKSPLRLASYANFKQVAAVLLGYGADREHYSEAYQAECYARYSWMRRRTAFLIRDRAAPAEAPAAALQRLLRERPQVFHLVVGCL